MPSLICPASSLRVDEHAARVTGLIAAGLPALSIATGSVLLLAAVASDFAVRGFTPLAVRWMSPVPVDQVPEIFAARGGFFFALAATGLAAVSATASAAVAFVPLAFALLEGAANVCVGCLVHSTVVVPWATRHNHRDRSRVDSDPSA